MVQQNNTQQEMMDAALAEAAVDELQTQLKQGNVAEVYQRITTGGVTAEVTALKVDGADASRQEYQTLYRHTDGKAVPILPTMVSRRLAARLPFAANVRKALRGTKAWLTEPPTDLPPQRHIQCMLHEDGERRAYMDSIGLAGRICNNDKMPDEFALRRHMIVKHKHDWEVIQEAKEQAERDDRIQDRKDSASAQRDLVGILQQVTSNQVQQGVSDGGTPDQAPAG